MNNKNQNPEQEHSSGSELNSPSRLGLFILLTVLISSLIVGGAVYAWQNRKLSNFKEEKEKQVKKLESKITELNNKIESIQADSQIKPDPNPELASGTGKLKTCEWTGFSDCSDFAGGIGECYQIKTKKGWEIVEYSEVGDLKEYLGHEIKWQGIRADSKSGAFCTKSCPCSIKLKSIEGVKIGEPVGLPAGWQVKRTEKAEYGYPQTVDGDYINTPSQNWPPRVIIKDSKSDQLLCEEEESKVILNGEKYCFNSSMEGTAGTTYQRYGWRGMREGKRVSLIFSLGFPSCGALPDYEQCKSTQGKFDPNDLAEKILNSISYFN